MEAKDTVIKPDELGLAIIKHPELPMGQGISIEQAEISFKMGMQKVVEWLKRTGVKIEDSDYYPHKGEKPKIFKAVYQHSLDKKLKEWGL